MSSCGNPSADHDGLMTRKRVNGRPHQLPKHLLGRLKFNNGRNCVKCRLNPGKIVIRHAVYCKECFTPLVTIKFRRALEPFVNANSGTSKRPKLKASGSLLLGFSGGLGSSVLLEMIQRTYFANEVSPNGVAQGGSNHPRNANVWTSCAVCYVEVCNAFPDARDRTSEIKNVLTSYPKLDFLPLRLEYAFDTSWWCTITTDNQDQLHLATELGKDGLYTEALRCFPSRDVAPVDALRTYLKSLPTQTAVSSAIGVLVRLLLLHVAKTRRASHLLLGTSLTTLSISLISCISQGGGHSILDELQEEWSTGVPTASGRMDSVHVIRPLRDVTMKECSMFAWWSSIHVVGRDRQARAYAGISGLTKDFIIGLEKDYPSTVSTIVRTCAKLEPKNTSVGLCILCHRNIQDGLDDWKKRISIRSYSDRKLGPDLAYLPVHMRLNSSDVLAAADIDQHFSILKCLCYPCRTTLTSKASRGTKPTPPALTNAQPPPFASLPVWVSTGRPSLQTQGKQLIPSENSERWVREPMDEADQRRHIASFLLDA